MYVSNFFAVEIIFEATAKMTKRSLVLLILLVISLLTIIRTRYILVGLAREQAKSKYKVNLILHLNPISIKIKYLHNFLSFILIDSYSKG